MICSELTTFAVESPTTTEREPATNSCDLLRINYLCGRITNNVPKYEKGHTVVICSELTTFAVESPTPQQPANKNTCCDLLRINYLCGRITNTDLSFVTSPLVVICSELTTFAVESPTYTQRKQAYSQL